MTLPGQRRVPTQIPDSGRMQVVLLRVQARCFRLAAASKAVAAADAHRIDQAAADPSVTILILAHQAFHLQVAQAAAMGVYLATRALADDRETVELLTWAAGLAATVTERFQRQLAEAHEGVTGPSGPVQALYAELVDAAAIIVASLRSLEHMLLGAAGINPATAEDEG